MAFSLTRTAPCPYCYEHIDPRRLSFRCGSRPAPGRPVCTKQEDTLRRTVLGDATPVLPSFEPAGRRVPGATGAICPDCGGTTGTRVCPRCHSVLPATFSADSPLFGIVGVRGSGKTVMLSMLTKELTSSVARRFDANIDAVGGSNLLTRLENIRQGIETGTGQLPDQTAANTQIDTVPAVYEWQIEKPVIGGISRRVSTILSFYDTAGEDLASTESTRDQHYLGAAGGLILLLDPFGFPENHELAVQRGVDPNSLRDTPVSVLHSLTQMLREAERLRANKKIKVPVAVVLAKIDAFFSEVGPEDPIRQPSSTEAVYDEAEAADLHHYVESLVSQWGGDDVLTMLRFNYSTYRFFVASSLGAEPDYRTRHVSSKGVRPHRVAEPLLWLMAQRGFIPSEG